MPLKRTLGAFALLGAMLLLCPLPSSANGSCPPIGSATSCNVLITIGPTGKLRYEVDPSVGPYDDVEDTLVGVQNASGATVFGIHLSGDHIFDFDGDGAGAGGSYAGPDTSFTVENANSGTVNFDKGLRDGDSSGSASKALLRRRSSARPLRWIRGTGSTARPWDCRWALWERLTIRQRTLPQGTCTKTC